METCYEYLGCGQRGCVMYGLTDGTPCWKAEGTLCNHRGIEIVRESLGAVGEEACALSACIYYKVAKTGSS